MVALRLFFLSRLLRSGKSGKGALSGELEMVNMRACFFP
jgi:hypothetical protein